MSRIATAATAIVLVLVALCSAPVSARTHSQPPDTGSTPRLDPEAATRAYLDSVPPDVRARSNVYFEGGYWLQLWNFLAGAAVGLLLLATRWSAAMRNVAERLTRRRPLVNALYWAQYTIVTSVLVFPLTWYQGFLREHQYGLATQNFVEWLLDQVKGVGLGVVLGAVFFVALYGVLRRAPRTWWIWGTAVSVLSLAVLFVIIPIFIDPVFNTYKPLSNESIRDPILSMARANGIQADTVYELDASRQTTRISANVAGFLGTERIALNDNLLKRCTLPEIKSVMAHEMGHYVLNHIPETLFYLAAVVLGGFLFSSWGFERVTARFGNQWDLRGIGDPAAWPLLLLLLSIYLFVLTPVLNTIIRVNESEADLFGLNAAAEPDGFATVSLKLGEYRKLEPSPFEEWFFYDHPSGRSRIFMAMQWKAEHPEAAR